MYLAGWWSWAFGHDGYPHAPVLITAIGLMGQVWDQVEGKSFDGSAIVFGSAQTGDEIDFAIRNRWVGEKRDAAGVLLFWRQPGICP
jgi:hypothetical protein